ncbi:ABC transporter ATP-binding protein [Methylobacterium organophilum]|uniref:ABC transporter ATP-binding protein n=1 Tax=Methylobacterium organophilum TaxID=410 RepID=UPI001F12B96A|nr:ABC transporter ATP-binding protein [Methylobacterium organophilum]UMY18331.1 ABC transporter ATP-binding protein [Methylobacterium organophilum]
MGGERTAPPVLRLSGLSVTYPHPRGTGGGPVLDDLSLLVPAGETVAVVGESGSGKSTLLRALLGLNPADAAVTWRRLEFRDPAGALRRVDDVRSLRGTGIGIVPQDPVRSLDPLMRIGANFAELHRHRLGLADTAESRARAAAALAAVGIDRPEARLAQYPHELSGGLLQRVLVALALVGDPQLLLADEPTSNLDATVQKRVLDLLDGLRAERGLSLLLVTHDIAVAARRADRILVLHSGRIVESGPAAALLADPRTAYARHLIESVPGRLHRGSGPAAQAPTPVVLEGRNLHKAFGRGGQRIAAVTDVGLRLHRSRTLAILGESGAGKSTLLRLLAGLERPDRGRVLLHGRHEPWTRSGRAAFRRDLQLVYQNPARSLNPAYTIGDSIAEPLEANGIGTRRDRPARVLRLLRQVELPEAFAERRPSQLSGGQLQRVAIARALALEPAILVLDEPVSALDQAVQLALLQLLRTLQHRLGIAYLLVSHDLAVVRALADVVIVLRGGRIEEQGTASAVFEAPRSAYTRRLLEAAPSLDLPSFASSSPMTAAQ